MKRKLDPQIDKNLKVNIYYQDEDGIFKVSKIVPFPKPDSGRYYIKIKSIVGNIQIMGVEVIGRDSHTIVSPDIIGKVFAVNELINICLDEFVQAPINVIDYMNKTIESCVIKFDLEQKPLLEVKVYDISITNDIIKIPNIVVSYSDALLLRVDANMLTCTVDVFKRRFIGRPESIKFKRVTEDYVLVDVYMHPDTEEKGKYNK